MIRPDKVCFAPKGGRGEEEEEGPQLYANKHEATASLIK